MSVYVRTLNLNLVKESFKIQEIETQSTSAETLDLLQKSGILHPTMLEVSNNYLSKIEDLKQSNIRQSQLVVDDESDKEPTTTMPLIDDSDGAYCGNYADPRGRVRDVCWLQNECEAVLSKPFHFYGSHMWVSQHDKMSLMQNELFTYYKGLLHQKESKVDVSQIG
jgi:hypothetical protein